MLNFLRPAIARLLNPVGQALARTPVTPNMITVIGTVGVSGAALSMFPIGELFPGAFTATIFVLTDMLDGLLARLKGSSGPFGAFLDSTMDRVADASIFGGMVIWFFLGGHNTLLAIVTLFCLACGFLVSYVKARAQGLGLACDVGLIERPERMLIGLTSVGLSGLGVPYVLPIGLWALAAGSLFTLGQRIRAVHQSAAGQAADPAETGPPAGPAARPESPGPSASPPAQDSPTSPAAPAAPSSPAASPTPPAVPGPSAVPGTPAASPTPPAVPGSPAAPGPSAVPGPPAASTTPPVTNGAREAQ